MRQPSVIASATVILALAACTNAANRTDRGSPTRGSGIPAAAASPDSTVTCPAPTPGYYDPVVVPTSGNAGSTLTVSGNVPAYGEDGYYVGPSGEIQFWWNLDPDLWWTAIAGSAPSPKPSPAGDGPVLLLTTFDVTGLCSYQVDLTVPTVSVGRYIIEPLSADGDSGTNLAPIEFTVTG